MATLTHTGPSGLLFASDLTGSAGDLAAILLGASYAYDLTHGCYIAYPSPIYPFLPSVSTSAFDYRGIREYQEIDNGDGTRQANYDGCGNPGALPWRAGWRVTTDGGITYPEQGPFTVNLAGAPAGVTTATSFINMMKVGSTFYVNAVLPQDGSDIPAGNYYSGPMSSPAMNGATWTLLGQSPALGGSGAYNEQIANPTTFVDLGGGVIEGYCSARTALVSGTSWKIERVTTSAYPLGLTDDGQNGAVITSNINSTALMRPENPCVWFSAALNKWVMAVNSIDSTGSVADGVDFVYSTTDNGWSDPTATYRVRSMSVCTQDSSPQAIGILMAIRNQANVVQFDANGSVPYTYDGDPTTPHAHLWRRPKRGIARKAAGSILCNKSSGLSFSNISIPHGPNFVLQVAENFEAAGGHGIHFLGSPVSQTGGPTGGFQWAGDPTTAGQRTLYKLGAGVNSGAYDNVTPGGQGVVATTTFTQSSQNSKTYKHRIVSTLVGGANLNIKIYTDANQANPTIDYTDNGSAHGPVITSGLCFGFGSGSACKTRFRDIKLYKAEAVAFTGLPAGATVAMKGAGVVFSLGTADGSGNLSLSSPDYPLSTVSVNNVEITPDAPLWGGDTLAYSSPVPSSNSLDGGFLTLSGGFQ